jgi:hypothetical protein
MPVRQDEVKALVEYALALIVVDRHFTGETVAAAACWRSSCLRAVPALKILHEATDRQNGMIGN